MAFKVYHLQGGPKQPITIFQECSQISNNSVHRALTSEKLGEMASEEDGGQLAVAVAREVPGLLVA